jgi:hypothetical protein
MMELGRVRREAKTGAREGEAWRRVFQSCVGSGLELSTLALSTPLSAASQLY